MARLYCRDIMAVSVKGRQYSVDGDGVLKVPDDIADHLIACFGMVDIGTEPPVPPPAETGKMIRLSQEDIAAVPVMGAIEAPEVIVAHLMASFGLGPAPQSIDTGVGPASEWSLEFATAVAAKLGIDVGALIRGALLNAVSAMAQAAAARDGGEASAAVLEEDALIGYGSGDVGRWLAHDAPPKGCIAIAPCSAASLTRSRAALVGHRANAPPPKKAQRRRGKGLHD